MYPNLYYLVQDLFGIQLNALKLVNSFGFFVALAFVASGYVLHSELKRKEALGEFTPLQESYVVGAPASMGELMTAFFFGFLFIDLLKLHANIASLCVELKRMHTTFATNT